MIRDERRQCPVHTVPALIDTQNEIRQLRNAEKRKLALDVVARPEPDDLDEPPPSVGAVL